MGLPALTDWDATRRALHQAAQVVGAVRQTLCEPLPNNAHLGLFVSKKGLTTGRLGFFNGPIQLDLDFEQVSFLWFARGFDEGHDPHLNIGFSPGSAGLPRPYVYLYASPLPPRFFDLRLPIGAHYWREGWNGIIIHYDWLANQPEAELEEILLRLHAMIAPMMVE